MDKPVESRQIAALAERDGMSREDAREHFRSRAQPLLPQTMAEALQVANAMASQKLVPAHLQKSVGDCLMVVEQAARWGMSSFAVAQCTSVIQGKLMYEGKLVAAALNTSGILEKRLREEFSGEGATRAVKLTGTLRGEIEPREIKVTLAEAKTNNGMWTKQPDQQLIYFATRAWARRHAPEVMLGVYSPEEFSAPPSDTFKGTTIEAEPTPLPPSNHMRPRTNREWLDAFELEMANATGEEVDAILARDDVHTMQDTLHNGAKDRLNHIINTAIERTTAAETNAPNAEEEVV